MDGFTEHNGKRRRIYREWVTPFEIFTRMRPWEIYLPSGIIMAELERFAHDRFDTESATEMHRAKKLLGR